MFARGCASVCHSVRSPRPIPCRFTGVLGSWAQCSDERAREPMPFALHPLCRCMGIHRDSLAWHRQGMPWAMAWAGACIGCACPAAAAGRASPCCAGCCVERNRCEPDRSGPVRALVLACLFSGSIRHASRAFQLVGAIHRLRVQHWGNFRCAGPICSPMAGMLSISTSFFRNVNPCVCKGL